MIAPLGPPAREIFVPAVSEVTVTFARPVTVDVRNVFVA